MLTRLLNITLLVFLLTFSQLFAYNKVEFYSIVAPRTPLHGVERIAVLNFSGEDGYGADFSDHLIRSILSESELSYSFSRFYNSIEINSTRLNESSYKMFDVIEREQLYAVFKEQGIEDYNSIEEANALEIGKTLSVDAILVGSVSYTYNIKHTKEKRERTYKNKPKKVWYEDCSEVVFQANVNARIIRVSNSEIIESFTPTYEYKNSACEYNRKKLYTREQCLQTSFKYMSSTIARAFVPTFASQKVELEKVKEKSIKKKADEAAKLADNYEFDEAYTIYKELYESDAYNPKLAFNLGLLHEIHGNFEKASALYSIAQEINPKEKEYTKGVSRINRMQSQAEALAEYGFTIQPHKFKITKDAMANKVKLKGKDSERIAIYSKPSDSSPVVTRVPGGMSFIVLSQEGKWFKLKLLGNKEGFLHADKVDD